MAPAPSRGGLLKAKVGPVPVPLLIAAVVAVGVFIYFKRRGASSATSAGSTSTPGAGAGATVTPVDTTGGGASGGYDLAALYDLIAGQQGDLLDVIARDTDLLTSQQSAIAELTGTLPLYAAQPSDPVTTPGPSTPQPEPLPTPGLAATSGGGNVTTTTPTQPSTPLSSWLDVTQIPLGDPDVPTVPPPPSEGMPLASGSFRIPVLVTGPVLKPKPAPKLPTPAGASSVANKIKGQNL